MQYQQIHFLFGLSEIRVLRFYLIEREVTFRIGNLPLVIAKLI